MATPEFTTGLIPLLTCARSGSEVRRPRECDVQVIRSQKKLGMEGVTLLYY